MNRPVTPTAIADFQTLVQDQYRRHGRDLPWRHHPTAYAVVVSELMLQQTQVSRVSPKFEQWIVRFPDFDSLAAAPLGEVLRLWSGLGYNRRARYLHETARLIGRQFMGELPADTASLISLPGIGPNTAGAIQAYAFNLPAVFIETNIRTVFLHHFFPAQATVSDRALEPLVAAALDHEQPRTWYWALMDYGAYLKQQGNRAARRSRHHTLQSRFEGSRRQLRGRVLRQLIDRPHRRQELQRALSDDRLIAVLDELTAEGLIMKSGIKYSLPGDAPRRVRGTIYPR